MQQNYCIIPQYIEKEILIMEQINEQEFEEKTKSGIVLVDFFATWCPPCRMLTPVLEDVQKELGEKVKIYKIDVDENENIARKFGIMSIPAMFVFVDGQEKDKHVGFMPKDEVIAFLKKNME